MTVWYRSPNVYCVIFADASTKHVRAANSRKARLIALKTGQPVYIYNKDRKLIWYKKGYE
jgi:phosphoribosyl-AMP cyclohydrolase